MHICHSLGPEIKCKAKGNCLDFHCRSHQVQIPAPHKAPKHSPSTDLGVAKTKKKRILSFPKLQFKQLGKQKV